MANEVRIKLALEGAAEVGAGIKSVGRDTEQASKTMAQASAAADVKVKDLGMSVKQLNAATRGIGPQFTDIFTSLASGQAPMTVLIQQGGQLKDLFGGVGPAARALGGYVAGLINPVTLAAAAVGGLAYAAYLGSKESVAYTRSIVMTGNATGVTAGQLGDMARKMADVRGTQAAAAEALAEMVGTGRVAREDLQKFSQVAVDMESTVGQSVGDTAKVFADLAKDPVKASLKLNETLGHLTAATYAQIKAAKEMGDDERAVALAQTTAADALATRTAQMKGSLGILERAWLGVKNEVKGAVDAMLSVGRVSSVSQQMAAASADLQARLERGPMNDTTKAAWEKGNAALKDRIAYLGEALRVEQRGAEAAGARAAAERAGVAAVDLVTTANERARTKQEQMNKALADYRKGIADIRAADPNSALLDPKKIAAAEDGIRRQYKETAKQESAYESLTRSIREKVAEVEAEIAVGKKLTDAEKLEIQYKEDLKGKLKGLTVAEREGIQALIDRLKLGEKTLESSKEALKVAEERQATARKEAASIAAYMEAQTEAANKSLKTVADRVQALQDEEQAVAISQEKNISLAAAVELVAIARLKEEQARKFVPGYEGWEAIQREIDKRQELLGLMNTKDLREREQSGWLSFYNSLDRTAQDTFTNVLEGGQGIWTKLRNTAKSVFFDWLYQMTAKKWLFNLTVSASGGALPASAGAGGLSNIGSLAGIGGSFGAGVGAGFSSLIGEAGIAGGVDAGMIALQAGNIAGGLGTLAGVLGPIALGIGAVYALAKNLDHSGTPHTGGGTSYSAASGLAQASAGASGAGLFSSGIAYDTSTEQMTTGLVTSIVKILDSTASAFGKQAGYQAAASFAADGHDGSYGALNISQLGQTISDFAVWKGHGQTFSAGEAGSAEFLARAASDVRTALDAMDLPGWAEDVLRSLGESPSLQQLADAVDKINQVQSAIASQRAGLQQQYDLLTGVTTQREIERKAQDESNRALYDMIVAEQDAQAETAKLAEEQRQAAEQAAQHAQAIAEERAGLQQQLDLLTGVTTQREIERKAKDESNRALYDEIQALQDQKAAAEAATAQAQALQEAERALAAERAGLMDQLWQATGQTAQIRAKQLGGLDQASRPIQQALFDVADAQTAFTRLQTAVQTEKDRITQQYNDDKAALQAQAQADTGYLKDALTAQQKAVNDELKLKQQGYADQIAAAQDARSNIAAIASSLASAVKSVKVESDAYDLYRLQKARSLIAGAASTGNVQATGLEDALAIAAQDSKQFYSTFEDYAFEQARTAGDIARLNDAAQNQLTGFDQTILALKGQDDLAKSLADAQLAALDAQYQLDVSAAQAAAAQAATDTATLLAALDQQYQHDIEALGQTVTDAQKQLDALLGVDNSVKTVAQSIDAFSAALLTAMNSVATVTAAAAIDTAMASSAAAVASGVATAPRVASTSTGPAPVKAGMYASGGFHPGGLRIVGEDGPELEATGPSRIWNASQIGSALRGTAPAGNNNAELVRAITALQGEINGLKVEMGKVSSHTRRTADAVNGNPEAPMLVESV